MVNPEKGVTYKERVSAILKQYAFRPETTMPTALNTARFRNSAAKGDAPRQDWWTPQTAPEPRLQKLEPRKKPVIERSSHAYSDDRSMAELIRDARRQAGRHVVPRRGILRLWGARLHSLLLWER